ncbi:hypothetical protein LTR86_007113 [Recurvomyces mirabilis]|nr:hypothetical protein LTR86_007113 [Recurvomyces mirabilis]
MHLGKVDGNTVGGPTPVTLQQISTVDGVTRIDDTQEIYTNDPKIDGRLAEAPGSY